MLKDTIKTIVASFVVLSLISIAYAWTEPASNPPAGNVSAPITNSSTGQAKLGDFGIKGLLRGYDTGALFTGTTSTNPVSGACPSGYYWVDENGNGAINIGECKIISLYAGSNGNVGIGIGTTAPGVYKLNVEGNTNITGNLNITSDPTANNHAATKGYTDAQINNILTLLTVNPPILSISSSLSAIEVGASTLITVNISGDPARNCEYSWNPTNTSITSATYTDTPSSDTTYTVSCSNYGGTSIKSTFIKVNPKPAIVSWTNGDTGNNACSQAGYLTCTTAANLGGNLVNCSYNFFPGRAICQ